MPEDDIARLARLIVGVLEIGTRRIDRMAGDFLAAWRIELPRLHEQHPDFSDRSRDLTRSAVTARLVERAGSPERLMSAFALSTGAVTAMVDGIYRVLAAHDSTTNSTSEPFRVSMDGTDLAFAISAAFIERIHSLRQQLVTIELGEIDFSLVDQFVRCDGGESYGRFPVDAEHGRPLLHEVMLLRPFRERLRRRTVEDPAFRAAESQCAITLQATDHLLERLQSLLVAHAADVFTDPDGDIDADEWHMDRAVLERETLLEHGLVGEGVGQYFEEFHEAAFVGLRVADGEPLELLDDPEPVRRVDLADRYGSSMSGLGAYLGLVRSGAVLREDRWGAHHAERGRALDVLGAPDAEPSIAWLTEVADAADAAVRWIDTEVWRPLRSATASESEYEEFLNLPLWRERDRLFEIWLLCLTIEACETFGWVAELDGMDGTTWKLPAQRAAHPVATITRDGLSLDIWREPNRSVTPDVTIATPAPPCRDLVVIEAKDRIGMPTGLGNATPKDDTAIGTGLKYVNALGAPLTWVCNHSDFRGAPADPEVNVGTPWHDVRLAQRFAPGSVPPAFESTLWRVLHPSAALPPSQPTLLELVVVLDTTSSMRTPHAAVTAFLDELAPDSFDVFSAILFGDHDGEYTIRPVARQRTPSALHAAISREPRTDGGDKPEALEDAMHHAAWLATGSEVFLVVTDAPPHGRQQCPKDLDFVEQVEAVLDAGAQIWVLDDWLAEAADAWQPFVGRPGFRLVSLEQLHRETPAT